MPWIGLPPKENTCEEKKCKEKTFSTFIDLYLSLEFKFAVKRLKSQKPVVFIFISGCWQINDDDEGLSGERSLSDELGDKGSANKELTFWFWRSWH